VSAPHLARSYHHLFPLDAFQEIPLEEYQGERYGSDTCDNNSTFDNTVVVFVFTFLAMASILLERLLNVWRFLITSGKKCL